MIYTSFQIYLICCFAGGSCILLSLLGRALCKKNNKPDLRDENDIILDNCEDGIVIMSDSYHNRK